ncbi:MAG: LLM class flavin-dependent oxidoreductase, partial [Haliea sp.]
HELPEGHPGRGVTAEPSGPTTPTLWMLGSSNYGAQLAAHYGLPYAFAYFITDGQGAEEAIAMYRDMYRPSPQHPQPQPALCVWALAADTEEAAWQHFAGRERWKIDRNRGALGPLQSPAELAQRPYSPAEQMQADQLRRNALVGSGAQVAEKLRALSASLEVEELVVITWAHDPAVRRRSYELLAAQLYAAPARTD